MFRKKGKRKAILYGLLIVLAATFIGGAVRQLSLLPDEIYLIGNHSRTLDVGLPMSMTLKDALNEKNNPEITVNGTLVSEELNLGSALEIASSEEGSAEVQLKLFGVIPIKDIRITSVEKKVLIPGGQSIGVMLHTRGALVVGLMDISRENGEKCNPAKKAGLQTGDIILEYDGIEIENAAHLSQLVGEYGEKKVSLVILRDQIRLELQIQPEMDIQTKSYKLGAWLRDSTVGVGTLTFYDPESGHLAGLGHAITDFDTGEILTVKDGTIVESQIIDVVKGEAGTPGELKGSFTDNAKALGSIERNTEYGIYGNAETELHNALYTYLEAADRSEVELGKATLLCTVDGNGVKEYSCQIIKVYDQGAQSQRSFIIEIDDAALLEKTGGIVQGMSGSPIIQNGKLIGAVTHVFIDNPKRGYGVYVDWMLQDMNEME
jgi:stage IV sporulation protein B